MHSPDEIEARFVEVIAEFKRLVIHGHAVSSSLAGKRAPSDREFYASVIFSKIVSHAITISRNTPRGLSVEDGFGGEVWDVSSICAISRSLIEAYDALAYIAVHPISNDARNFRVKVWELHDKERRLSMLKHIGSKSPVVSDIENEVVALRAEVLKCAELDLTHASNRGKIAKGECPEFLQSLEARNQASEVSHPYYLGARMFLSAYVHTHPFTVHQLVKFRAGDAASLNLISLAVRYAVVFLAKSIEGMRYVFGTHLPVADEATNKTVIVWCGIAKKGVSDAG